MCLLLPHLDRNRVQAVPDEVVDDVAELSAEGAVLLVEDIHRFLIDEAKFPEVLFGNPPGMCLEQGER